MNRNKELKVWNKAMDLVVDVYKVTILFPSEEKFGVTSQVRRSAVSIPSNISEGAGRNSDKEFNQFIGIANGSTCELETQLILAQRLGWIPMDVNPCY
ncbi:MAG TPA: four helix bundle protein [Flavobacteriales bacterium]|nr:four helix bundle protein [Flavobacteriales bacterium]